MPDDEVFDEDGACAELLISPRQLRRLRESRQLAYIKVGKTPRYLKSDIEEYKQSHRREALR